MLRSLQPTTLVHRFFVFLVATVVSVLCVLSVPQESLAQPNSAPIPLRAPDDPWLIRDDARLFNEDQLNRFQFDLRRLQGLGENVMVYTRRADASRRDSEGFAKRVREAWDIESAPDADDGLLMLITVSDTSPQSNSFVVSSGSNFFPVNQMEGADLNEVYEAEIEPNFRENRYDVALAYGVRRVLYAADYTPPNPPALTGANAFAHEVGNIGGSVLLQAALLGLAIVPAFTERRLTTRPLRKSVLTYATIFGTAAPVLGVFSVVGRSGLGVLTAMLVTALVLAVTGRFLAAAPTSASASAAPSQRVRVSPSFGRNRRRFLDRIHQRRGHYVPQP